MMDVQNALSLYQTRGGGSPGRYLLLGGLLRAVLQRVFLHGPADTADGLRLPLFQLQPQLPQLGDVALAHRLFLLTWTQESVFKAAPGTEPQCKLPQVRIHPFVMLIMIIILHPRGEFVFSSFPLGSP